MINNFYLVRALTLSSFGLCLLSFSTPAQAADASGLQAALASCGSSVAKDDSGRPDRTAFDACMTAAGFTKPAGGPGGGRGGPGGPGGPGGSSGGPAGLHEAMEACRSSVSLDSSGQPDRTAIDACMTAKGFQKPQGGPPGMGGQPGSQGDASADSSNRETASSSGISGGQ